jgi:hypothetical protein
MVLSSAAEAGHNLLGVLRWRPRNGRFSGSNKGFEVSETRDKQEIGVGKEALIANRSSTSIDGPYSRLLLLNLQSICNQFIII